MIFRPYCPTLVKKRYDTIRDNAIRHDTIRYDTIRDNTIRYKARRSERHIHKECWAAVCIHVVILLCTSRYDTIHYKMLYYDTIRYDTIQDDKIRDETIRYDTIRYNIKWLLDRSIRSVRGFNSESEKSWLIFSKNGQARKMLNPIIQPIFFLLSE